MSISGQVHLSVALFGTKIICIIQVHPIKRDNNSEISAKIIKKFCRNILSINVVFVKEIEIVVF